MSLSSVPRIRAKKGRTSLVGPLAIATAVVLLAAGLTATGPAAPAAAAAALECFDTVYFSTHSPGNVGKIDLATGTTTTPVFTTPADAGTATNQLGIGAGGSVAIAGTSTSVLEYEPEASADGTITVSPKTPGVAQGTMGAVNPLNGLYYYGGYAGTTVNIYVFDPATNTAPPGPVVSVSTVNAPGRNGDMAFDKAGRLYIVSGSATVAALYVAEGVIPTSGTGTTLTSTELSRGSTTVATNGIAFGSDGFLYLGGTTVLQKTNPITGAPTGTTYTLTDVSSADLGSCANPSTAEIVTSFDGPRAQPTDQARVVVEGGSYGPNGTTPDFPPSTSGDDGAGVTSEPGLIIPGETYTMRQDPVGTTDLDDYETTWSCTDAAGTVIASGSGNTATFTAPSGTDGANIDCSFVNVLPPPVAVADTGVATFGDPITLAGATNDQPGTGEILPDRTVFTNPAATDGGKRLETADGVWTIGTDGRITFTPAPGFSGDATAEYRILDDNGQTSTSTATGTVRPGPTAADDTAATTQGASVQIAVLGNDAPGRNADGTAVTISPASVLFEVTGQPAGTVVSDDRRRLEVPGEGAYTIDPTTGVVTFAPDTTFDGPTASTIAYGVTDSLGNPATAKITVTVSAVDPTAVNDAITTPHGTPVTVDVVGNDRPGPGGAIVSTSTVLTDPAATDGGTVLVTPQGTWRVTPGGRVEFAPADGFSGTATTPYRITDENGQQSSASVSVTVRPGPVASADSAATAQNVDVSFPVIDNDVPGTAADGSAGTFDADSLRFDVTPVLPAGSALSADGRVLTVPGEGVYTFAPASAEVTFDPEPQFTGTATPVTYTVTDEFGNDASSTITVTVTAVTPTAIGDAAKTPGGTPVMLDILANDEPGAASAPLVPTSVVFTSPDATDGGKTLVVPGEGTWTVQSGGTARFAPVPGFSGPATPVTYRVSDENGTPATAEITVTVGSGAIAAPDAETTLQNTAAVIDVLANDFPSDLGNPCDPADPGGPAGCDTGVLFPPSVAFPIDGQPAGATVADDGTRLTVPGEGVYSADPAGQVTFTPEPQFTGRTSAVVYTARDSHDAALSSTITITVTPVTPRAQDDSATTAYGVAVALDLLDDDSAGDTSAPLVPASTVFPVAGQPGGVAVSADGRTLTIDRQGTFVLGADGTVVFTPAAGFTGTTTSVLYRITDANGTTADAGIQVTVRPGPSAAPDTETTLQGIPVTEQPFANDVASRNADDSAGAWDLGTLRFPTIGQPADAQVLDGGTRLVVPGEGAYTAAADGSVEFTPLPQFSGTATPVTYTGTDEIGNAVTSTITIDVVPVVPSAADDTAATPFATPVTFDVAGNDEPGDPAVPLDPASAVFEASGIPAGLAAEIRDDGKTLDVADEGVYTLRDDGTVTFTPATGFHGDTTPVRYTILDENGSSTAAALSVTVRPGPAANPDAERTPQNVPVTVDILGNDRPGQRADGTDAALVAASVVFTTAGQPAGATLGDRGKSLDVPGEGVYEIETDGQVTFTPVRTFRGIASPIAYAVTDSLGNAAASRLTITVPGIDPIARNDTATTRPGVQVVIDVLGDDSPGTDGAPLDRASLRIVGSGGALVTELVVPGEGVWTVIDGRIVFTPDDGFVGTTTPITYSVADANGTRVTATVTVTVSADAALPTTGGTVPWVPLGAGLLLLLAGVAMLIRRRSAG
ncbi:Ig-like domain-containing protein [Microbacterium sp. SA39]|uniref:Ig-like domain-containing protein n=1 Tax=Microbacterium sp. SA39 TaxID=1263625 RepID=UPI0005FA3799|nr:cadherin-like domain-containing protein [Microbacterium sp. SA39]KJQ52849.1 HYR domain protein [Microbacterium sp. SA39]